MRGVGMAAINVNGVLPVKSLADVLREETSEAQARTAEPVVQGLAAYVKQCWNVALTAKLDVEQRMLRSLRQRRGEYDPLVATEIQRQGMSEVYMMLTSNKCRAGAAWLRDTLLGARDEKCWGLEAPHIPDLPDDIKAECVQEATQEAMQMYDSGMPPDQHQAMEIAEATRDRTIADMHKEAQERVERMELKMEDQLTEGGFQTAFSAFLDDIMTFPAAILKGPITRKKPKMTWVQDPKTGEYTPQIEDKLVAEWERVDPFHAYPAPNSINIDDGFFIERHRLSRTDLNELKGVEGYDDAAIQAVLDEYGKGGLYNWLYVDAAKAQAEGRNVAAIQKNPDGTIEALQFWGGVQGKMLSEWGMSDEEVGDLTKEYHCEIWLIGGWVIKATLNYDPFHRKPYYKTSFEEVPGAFWGNAPPDLIRDCQGIGNYAMRALANNIGIASGPQVVYNIDRLPAGEDLTQMYPWKLWQVVSDPYGNSAKPIEFFQPDSRAQELMGIYEKMSVMADEFSGIPRYMTGDNASLAGAGRTASGMSMLMSNAGKTIKQVITNIDVHIIKPLIERLYFYNMKYALDPDLKGSVTVKALGANSLVVKDAAQMRRNEFLQVALNNQKAQEVIGDEGIAALLYEQAKTLDMDADGIVPSPEMMRMRMIKAANMQMQAQVQQMQQAQQPMARRRASQKQLMTGEPVTDTFSKQPQGE